MPPTVIFKTRSLLLFALVAEVTNVVYPEHVKIHISNVVSHCQFNEFYCVCGFVCSEETYFLYHVKSMHLVAHKLLSHLTATHLPIQHFDFSQY